MQGLKEWMLENLGPRRFRTEDTQANASQTEDAGDGGLFMDGTEEYIIDGTGGSESRGGTGGSESRGGTGGQAPESIVSTESEKFPNSPEVKSFNSLLAVRNDKMEELKDLLAQHADPNMAKKSSTDTATNKHRTLDPDKDPSLLPPDATDKEKAEFFYNAAAMLEKDEDAKFSDGTIWTERACLCAALAFNPNLGPAYHDLGVSLKYDEKISLFGHEWSNKMMWIRAIDCNPLSRLGWWTLSEHMEDGDTICFEHNNGGPWDRHRILMRCINFAKGEKITMKSTEECPMQDVYLRAIQIDPTFSYAYARLAQSLQPCERITLPNGTQVCADELFALAQEMNPYSLQAWTS
jgi:hypothetical protein